MPTWHVEFGLTGQLDQQQIDTIGDLDPADPIDGPGSLVRAHLVAGGRYHRLAYRVEVADFDAALDKALADLASLSLPALEIESVTIRSERALARDQDLVNTAEFAELLSVSEQRVRQLRRDHPAFPRPVLGTSGRERYRRVDAEVFAALDRRAGRPRKQTQAG